MDRLFVLLMCFPMASFAKSNPMNLKDLINQSALEQTATAEQMKLAPLNPSGNETGKVKVQKKRQVFVIRLVQAPNSNRRHQTAKD